MSLRARSSHLVVRDAFGRYYIVSSLVRRRDTQVIAIECATGRLRYTATPGVDLFATPDAALQAIAKAEVVCDAWALLGYLVLGNEGLLLVACDATQTCTVPPHHDVLTIKSTAWVRVPLTYQFYPPLDDREMAYLNSLLSLEMSEGYYYCEGYDATHPFPNRNAPREYSREFVWNLEMRGEFLQLGIDEWCAVVLCGHAACVASPDYTMSILSRRSCLNARFLTPGVDVAEAPAPGLSPDHAPPNEYEVEFLVHTTNPARDVEGRMTSTNVVWASHVSRTGGLPIEGTTEDAPHAVPAHHTDAARGAQEYWKHLLRRYGSGVQLLCVSLLNPRHSDSRRMEQSLNDVKKLLKVDVEYACCDWKGRMAAGGFGTACEGLWAITCPHFEAHGVASGREEWDLAGRLVCARSDSQQRGVVRYSCAHGVLGSGALFAAALQILPEMVRRVHPAPYHPALLLNVSPDAPWPLKHRKLSELRLAVPPESLRGIAALLAEHSSLLARLYTGQPNDDLAALFASFDVTPPARHRHRNVKAMDVMHKIYKAFPRLAAAYAVPSTAPDTAAAHDPRSIYQTQLLSDQALLPYDVPCAFDVAIPKALVLLAPPKLQFEPWVVPAGRDSVTLTMVLPTFSTVTEVHVTVRHTGPETEWLSLARMDVLVGRHVDTCLPAFKGVLLPLVADNTTLRYVLPTHLTGGGDAGVGGGLYNFNNTEAEPLVKVVQVVFHSLSPSAPMLVGGVQLYGRRAALSQPTQQKEQQYDAVFRQLAHMRPGGDAGDAGVAGGDASFVLRPATPRGDSDEGYDSASDFGAFSVGVSDGAGREGEARSAIGSEAGGRVRGLSAGDGGERGAPLVEALQEYRADVRARVRRRVGFTEALDMEAKRVAAGIPSHLRDLVLYELRQDPAAFDPSRLLFAKDATVEASMRKRYRDQTPSCSNDACQKTFRLKWGKMSCSYCRMTFCSKCMAHDKRPIIEYRWEAAVQDVCLRCEDTLQQQRQRIRQIRRDLPRTNTAAPTRALAWLARHCLNVAQCRTGVDYGTVSSKPHLIADLHSATVLAAVPTDPRSPPIESVLHNTGPDAAHAGDSWYAPSGVDEVTIDLCLGAVADVTSVLIVGDRHGYEAVDALSVDVAIGAVASDLTRISEGQRVGELAPGAVQEVLRPSMTVRQRQGTRVVRITVTRRNPPALSDADGIRGRLHIGGILVYGTPRAAAHGDTLAKAIIPARKDPPHANVSYLQHTPPSTLAFFLSTYHRTINTTELRVEAEDAAPPGGRGAGWVLDVRLKEAEMSRTVMGFYIHHTHDDPGSHARDVRVTCFRFFSSDAQSQIHAGDFVLPSVAPGTHLQYLFPAECQLNTVRKVRFEVLSHYGSATQSKPTVSLFASTSTLHISKAQPTPDVDTCAGYVERTAEEYAGVAV